MSKAKDAMRYAVANEKRFEGLSMAEQLAELRRLRQGRVKMAVALGKAERSLEAVEEFKAVAQAKSAVQAMEAAIEGTLMLIDRGQGEMDLGQGPAGGVVGTMPMVDQETGEVLGAMPRRREA